MIGLHVLTPATKVYDGFPRGSAKVPPPLSRPEIARKRGDMFWCPSNRFWRSDASINISSRLHAEPVGGKCGGVVSTTGSTGPNSDATLR